MHFKIPTLKLTLEKIRLGFFRRVQRFVVCFHCRSLFPKVAVMFMQPSCMGEGFSPPTEQMLFPIYQESPILTSPKADSQFYLGERPPMGLIPISQARSKKHYPGPRAPLEKETHNAKANPRKNPPRIFS